jgi:pimeloyl-ACP methyl ester carboxylesterase
MPLRAFTVVFLFLLPATARADWLHPWRNNDVMQLNRKLGGKVLDFTDNHDRDARIWSKALHEKRSVYVYLPPGYDGCTQYPVMLWLHGFGQGERTFLDIIEQIDQSIRCGRFPPCIIATPDGSLHGHGRVIAGGSFYMNSNAGHFEDFIVYDVWGFLLANFCIRPEREAHVLAGASMGGYGAYMLSFRHPECFGVIGGILPALDIRYADCHNRYFRPYDPNCVMERDEVRRLRVIARFRGIPLREKRLTDPLLGFRHPNGLRPLAEVNPVELLETLDIQPGDFAMFIGYAGKDEFNLNAQTDHFLDVARRRGIYPTTLYLPRGHHSIDTGRQMIPAFSAWLLEMLTPYCPTPIGPLSQPGAAYDLLTCKARSRSGTWEPFEQWPGRAQLP